MSAAEPRERPILFSGEMVRRILDGSKTQTRRVIRIDDRPVQVPARAAGSTLQRGIPSNAVNVRMCAYYLKCDAPEGSNTVSCRVPCPYGWFGDRLWVRETWCLIDEESLGGGTQHGIIYRADEPAAVLAEERQLQREGIRSDNPWRPSIHMPRAASRITLEITEVRVERLQDISAEDSLAEGIPRASVCGCEVCRHSAQMCPADAGGQILAFRDTWDHINGERKGCDWESNPYVWALTFKRIKS